MTRRRRRRVWRAQLAPSDAGRWALTARRGAHSRTTDGDGNVIADTFDAGATLHPNIGDRLVVSAADLASDAVACVVVAAMLPDARPLVELVTGELPAGAVHVMLARKAARARRVSRRAAAGRA